MVQPGARLGSYEIVSPVGSGGMGEVYKARDTRLNRTVAVKVLSARISANPELRTRFQREAQAIAALNHPHACAVYDVGQQDGIDYLVMEYLDGETLASRLSRGPLPLDQALVHAAEIADALASAHRSGVVHRDLKPSNIALTPTGAKILDFGLARLITNEQRVSPMSDATVQSNATAQGTIIGTLQYMSPEQLEGKDADDRSDVFSFGAVLYEMLTARKAFEGQSQASLIAAIMEKEPPAANLTTIGAPLDLERTLRKCLAKNPEKRWQSAVDLRDQLLWISEPGVTASAPVARTRRREMALAGIAVLLLSALVLAGVRSYLSPEIDQPLVRFPVHAPDGAAFPTGPPSPFPAVSFDGRHIAFQAGGKLWIRDLESLDARELPGTEGGSLPFWSPDGRYIGFFQDRSLKKIDVSGGPPQKLCDSGAGEGAAWSPDGASILFASGGASNISIVPAVGGLPKDVTSRREGESSHSWPSFLPDGRHFVYFLRPASAIYVGSLDGGQSAEVVKASSKAIFVQPGYLLFLREQTLMAQGFDPDKRTTIGEPTPLAEEVRINFGNGRAAFSVSWNGVLAFRSGTNLAQEKELLWYDRTGKELGKVGETADYRGIALSPDETRVAVHIHDNRTNGGDIWLLDVLRGGASRFSFMTNAHYGSPYWSPDGKYIAYDRSDRSGAGSGRFDTYQKASDGAGDEKELLKTGRPIATQQWSLDEKYFVYDEPNQATSRDVWILPLTGDRKPYPFVNSSFNEQTGQISPDGRWLAYMSDETGRFEVYIQPFDRSGGKWPISTEGGFSPVWNRNGGELFFIALDKTLMSAAISVAGNAVQAGAPKRLFGTRLPGNPNQVTHEYAVTSDGQRFLINSALRNATVTSPEPLTVVLNWPKALKQ